MRRLALSLSLWVAAFSWPPRGPVRALPPAAPGVAAPVVVAGPVSREVDVFDASGRRLERFQAGYDGGDRIALGDVDGDGVEEILVANDVGGRVDIFDQGGLPRGSFAAGYDLGDGFATGDVDGDGADEILVAGSVGGRVHIFDASGAEPYPDFAAGFDAGDAFDTGDVDGNGVDEILVAGDLSHRVHIFDRNGAEPFSDFPSGYDPGDGFATGDVDGDGTDEILVAGDVGHRVHIFDRFGSEIYADFNAGFDAGDRLAAGDVDGDGEEEILVAGDVSRLVDVFDRSGARPCPAFDAGFSLGDGFAVGNRAYPDADGDGLLDPWEQFGLDADGDGTIDVDLPALGADPLHKDLFLEIDRRRGLDAIPTALVRDVFAAAPPEAGGAPNPDGVPGIALHVDQSSGGGEVDIPDFCNMNTGEFYAAKALHFDPVRSPVYRYAIAVHGTGCSRRGQGETGGNDLFLLVEPSAIPPALGGGTTLPKVLLHELGHTLNLQHGGDESDDCKPNYPSVMNRYGVGLDYSPPRTATGRGRPVLPPLREDALEESMVLDPTDDTNFITFVNGRGELAIAPLNEPVDWNGNGVIDPGTVRVNINTLIADDPTAGSGVNCANDTDDDLLTGHDDWSAISLRFRQFGNFEDSPLNLAHPNEADPGVAAELFVQREINTTDLEIEKIDLTDPAIPGQEVRYRLTVRNRGPNPATDVRVMDTLPAEMKYVRDDAGCVLAPANTLTCALGTLRARHTAVVEITARVDAALVIDPDEPLILENRASVENLAGPDPRPANDADSEQTSVAADRDGDGIADPVDLCPYYASRDQRDTDGDRRGDVCECGDQNGDGRNTVSDLVAINEAIFRPALVTPLCDANNDALCNVRDLISANIEIFSPGNTSTCARQPVPGP